MPTHYHVLATVPDDELARVMHTLNHHYATRFNRRDAWRRACLRRAAYKSVKRRVAGAPPSGSPATWAKKPAPAAEWRWSSFTTDTIRSSTPPVLEGSSAERDRMLRFALDA